MAIHQVNNMDRKVRVDLKLPRPGFAQLIHSPSKWVVEPMQVLKRKTLGGQNMSLKHNYCSLSRMAIMILSPIIVAKLTIMHHFRLTHTTGTSASTTKWACSPPFCLKWSVWSPMKILQESETSSPPRCWTTWPTWRVAWAPWSSAPAGRAWDVLENLLNLTMVMRMITVDF